MSKGISRRAFIASGITAAAATAVATAGLAGCAPAEDTKGGLSSADGGDASEVRSYPVHLHETDVLVIGGGIAGCMAAIRARQLGSTVSLVDKGQFGHSGTSGMNWGHMYTCYDESEDMEASAQTAVGGKIRTACGMSDQSLAATIGKTALDLRITHFGESLGMLHERLEDGTLGACFHGNVMKSPTSKLVTGFYPRFMNQKVQKMGADIFDEMMLVDVMVDENNEATGGICLDLRSGETHVFHAKSVIMAMGVYNWMCGWTGSRPQTMCGPECTGDSIGILMNRGLAVGNLEFVSTDFNAWNPGAFRILYGMGLEFPDSDRAINSEGEYFLRDYVAAHPEDFAKETLTQLVAGEVVHGRGSENGGVWLDRKGWSGQEIELFYRRTDENMKRNFNYEYPEKVEVVADHWSSYGTPKIDLTMQTEIPGLYYASYNVLVSGMDGCLATGHIAGENAAMLSASKEAGSINWNQVNEVVAHTNELLEREVEGGIPAWQVMRNIQVAYGEGLNLIREEAGIQAALDEFKRIKSEDVPKMYVGDKSRVFNNEWKHALETEYMVDTAIGVAMAALERRESRFMHVRKDYPAQDNDNYLVSYFISKNGDDFTLETVEPDMAIMDKETLVGIFPKPNINSWEEMRQSS